MNDKKKSIIVVLGMHRSGTSAITRGLQVLGVELGDKILPPVEGDNPKGYWEDLNLNALNIEILSALDSDWHHLAPMEPSDVETLRKSGYFLRAVELIRHKFGSAPIFGFKDPRVAKLLPFWKEVFSHCQFAVSYVVVVRHPLSVVKSLDKRGGIEVEQGYLLWLGHVIMSLTGSADDKRVLVDYDRLMQSPDHELNRMAKHLDLEIDPIELQTYKTKFLDQGLRHTVYDLNDLLLDNSCPPIVREVYAALLDVASDQIKFDDPELQNKIMRWSDEFERLRSPLLLVDKLLAQKVIATQTVVDRDGRIACLSQAVHDKEVHIGNLDHALRGCEEHIANLNQAMTERVGQIASLNNAMAERGEKIASLNNTMAERGKQIASLNNTMAERGKQIASLNNALAERGEQIASLNNAMAERGEKIASLNQALAERDGQIASLNKAMTERGEKIASLNKAMAERNRQIASLNKAMAERDGQIAALYNSTSWRMTWPLRIVAHQIKRVRRVAELAMPAIKRGGGLKNTLKKAIQLFLREGLAGIRRGFRMIATPDQTIPTQGSGKHDRNDYAEWVRRYDTFTDESRATMRMRIDAFTHKPLISVVMPVYNPPLNMLEEAIRSVQGQLYPNWELCIADDASTDVVVHKLLQRYADNDSRIKVVFREKNGHISAASNSALALVNGEYVALLDNDDLLRENALFWIADAIITNPDAGLIYSDEDKIDQSGRRYDPYFKPDWNPDLFLSHNMICHLGAYRTDLVRKLDGFREGYEGAQDYDLALRCTEQLTPQQIVHIPRVLYHWRSHPGSTAQAGSEKNYALLAGKRALNDHFERTHIAAKAELLDFGMYRVRYTIPIPAPLITLIIPTRNGLALIKQCIESIVGKTTYKHYEILIVDNNSDDPDTLDYFASLSEDNRIRILRDERPFNYSALNNAAVQQARGEYVGLINNDIEVISPAWLEEMIGLAIQPGVGAVGARLWYPNDTLQHGGCITGIGGVAGHSHKHLPRGHFGYFARAQLIQTFSVVTAACLVVKKSIFQEVGGLDETNLKVAFNDVDFCLRVREAGYRNVWTPYAELYHHESATRGYENTPEKKLRFRGEARYIQKRWGNLLLNDPAYSPNLTLERQDFSYAWPPRVGAYELHKSPSRHTINVTKTLHEPKTPPQKMVFIHVAKTAGTSVKEFLSQNFEPNQCVVALERNPEWIQHKRLAGIDQLQFISGHISYAQLESRINLSHFLVVTCIRNPLEHIVSHIAHFRRLADEKYRIAFNASSAEMKALILKLADLDLASPQAITDLYKNITNHELQLFDNCQTRYFTKDFDLGPTGQRIGSKELELALQTLKKIDLVGDTHELQTFLGAVSQRMGWPSPQHIPTENLNSEKYGMDIRNPAMVNALWPFIHYDMELYSQRAQFLCSL